MLNYNFYLELVDTKNNIGPVCQKFTGCVIHYSLMAVTAVMTAEGDHTAGFEFVSLSALFFQITLFVFNSLL